MIDNIWSGWRSEYLNNLDLPTTEAVDDHDHRSIFTRILESGLPDAETFIVHRGRTVFTIMNSFPYSVGHVLVLPYRQIAELGDLSPEETTEIWSEVERGVRVLRQVLAPDGFNIGLNLGAASGGSVSEHLHVHVVPRRFGDSNFTVATASMKTISEALDVTADRLRSAWKIGENDSSTDKPGRPDRDQ
jgi:ATP adenylyltransferase